MFEIQKREAQSIKKWYRIKDELDFDPSYQRDGEIWPLSKKQLLIDSIINKFDLPKFYIHDLIFGQITNGKKKISKRYAIVDGKQRLQTIFSFMDDGFSLSDDFEYSKNEGLSSSMRGMTYSELKMDYPDIIEDFDTFTLDVTYILTDELDKIDETFLRLNEGTPVNAQEKRLARSAKYRNLVTGIERDVNLKEMVTFSNHRQAYTEVITKLLKFEVDKEVTDLKKVFLDDFAEKIGSSRSTYNKEANQVVENLKKLKKALGSIKIKSRGILPVYYMFHKQVSREKTGYTAASFKNFIQKFEAALEKTKKSIQADKFDSKLDTRFAEFNRLNQQGTNDPGSILSRIQILYHFYKIWIIK